MVGFISATIITSRSVPSQMTINRDLDGNDYIFYTIFFKENDLTAKIDDHRISRDNLKARDKSSNSPQPQENIAMTLRSPVSSETSTTSNDGFSENEALFNDMTKSLVSPVHKRGHRRAFSTDTIM